jgi:anti-sigma factor RsiW
MLMPTNIHPSSRTLISYLDGELPVEERVEIAEHVSKCVACRSELDYMEADLDWFLVLEAAARPIETAPQPGGLSRLLSATRQWRSINPGVTDDGVPQTRPSIEQQTAHALELFLGPAMAAAVQRQNAEGSAESLLASFLGKRAAATLMTDIRRGNLSGRLASEPS